MIIFRKLLSHLCKYDIEGHFDKKKKKKYLYEFMIYVRNIIVCACDMMVLNLVKNDFNLRAMHVKISWLIISSIRVLK